MIYTFGMENGHLQYSALQKSFSATWQFSISASAQSRSANEKANRGLCGVGGHKSPLASVIAIGSQEQHENLTVCCIPAL